MIGNILIIIGIALMLISLTGSIKGFLKIKLARKIWMEEKKITDSLKNFKWDSMSESDIDIILDVLANDLENFEKKFSKNDPKETKRFFEEMVTVINRIKIHQQNIVLINKENKPQILN